MRNYSLRTVFGATIAVMPLLALGASVALIVQTTRLHAVANQLGSAMESVRIAQSIELTLMTHSRAVDTITRAAIENRLKSRLLEARSFVGSQAEAGVLDRLSAEVDAYLLAAHADADAAFGRATEALERAYLSAGELVVINRQQGKELQDKSARWNVAADLVGVGFATLVIAGLITVGYWLRRAAFRPAWAINDALLRFTRGDRAVRAVEDGPTEFRSIAHRFNAMASELERRSEDRTAFLSGVAHDLRNPLAAIKLSTYVIAPDRPLPPEGQIRTALARISRQLDRLDRMVWDLLDTSKIEAGRLDLNLELCDVRTLAREIVEVFRAQAPSHEISLDVGEQPVEVRADPMRLEQVLSNLVSNAIKYSPAGGPIEVRVGRSDDAAELSVKDSGVGISKYDVTRIFEPFQRGAGTAHVEGVGMGLYVARRLVEAHGGRIVVESAEGSGSCFRALIPLASKQAERMEDRRALRGTDGEPAHRG